MLKRRLEFAPPVGPPISTARQRSRPSAASIERGIRMNNRQRRILAQQIGQFLAQRQRVVSIPLTSAMLEMEVSHLQCLERKGLFPTRIRRDDGSRGYDLSEIHQWLQDVSHAPR